MRKLLHGLKSDESLMLAYQRGDASAFEVLYKRHKDGVYAFLYRSCAQSAVVEELVQDAWLSIIRTAERYEPRAKFKTYLFQVAHNKLIDHWRHIKHQGHDVDIDEHENIAPDEVSPEDQHHQLQTRQTLTRALARLPSEQRDAFLLREEGFSQEQIGHIVGVGKETVKSRLRYASKQLKGMLEGSFLGDGYEMSATKMTGVKQ